MELGVAAEGGHIAGLRPAMFGSGNLSTASLRRSVCFPAEPYPAERHLRIRQVSVPVGIDRTFPAAGMRFWKSVIPILLLIG
jgi:hypothetical protein